MSSMPEVSKQTDQVPQGPTRREFLDRLMAVVGILGVGGLLAKLLEEGLRQEEIVQANIDNSVPRSVPGANPLRQNPKEIEQKQIAVLNTVNNHMQELFRDVKWPGYQANFTYAAFITRGSTPQQVEDPRGILATHFPDEKEGETVVNPDAINSPNGRQIYGWDWGKDVLDGETFNTFLKQRNEVTGEENIWAVRLQEEGPKPIFWRISHTDAFGHTTWRVSFFTITVSDKGGQGVKLERSPAFDGESFLKPPMLMTITNPYAAKK